MSMDVESYLDARCLKELNYRPESCPQCEQSVEDFCGLLNEHGIKGTFFTVASFADKCGSQLKNAISEGHEIALHGLNHVSPLTQSDKRFINDTVTAKRVLEEKFGTKIIGYRAPCFGVSDETVAKLYSMGFKYDSSDLDFSPAVNSGKIDLSRFKKLNDVAYENDGFYEFKPCSSHYFGRLIPVSGGGYFRLLPFITFNVKRYLKNADAYLFYVHPFEVFKDKLSYPDNLSLHDKLYIQCRRKNYLERIGKLIGFLKKTGYEFINFKQFIEENG